MKLGNWLYAVTAGTAVVDNFLHPKMCDDISSTHGFVDDELAEKLSGMGDACVYRICLKLSKNFPYIFLYTISNNNLHLFWFLRDAFLRVNIRA